MSICKLAGLETEFAISGDEPIHASNRVVRAYRRIPLGVMTNSDLQSQTTANPCFASNGGSDLMLPNGARLYVDHAHPEYCTPETADPCVVVMLDRAGNEIVRRCAKAANGEQPGCPPIRLYKNNSDHYGNSYACHENYLMEMSAYVAMFGKRSNWVSAYLAPFLVSRIVYCGAGKVGAENGSPASEYQLSQRADFFERLLGLQTTHNRPIVNTRDEPHADSARFRRLHVIAGDANMCPYAAWLKVGTTQIILRLLEDDALRGDYCLDDPMAAMRQISRDLAFTNPVRLRNGRQWTGIEIQSGFLDSAHRYFAGRTPSRAEADILAAWGEALLALRPEPLQLIGKVDWVTKRWVIEEISKDGVDWGSPQAKELDLKYHALSPDESIFSALEEAGLVAFPPGWRTTAVAEFLREPPTDSRAWTRGKCIARFCDDLTSVDWEELRFRSARVHLRDPRAMTPDQTARAFATASASEFLSALFKDVPQP